VNADCSKPDTDDDAVLEDVVGYLNFSSGVSDPKFLRHINELYCAIEQQVTRDKSLPELISRLLKTLERLQTNGGPFADATQARAVIDLLSQKLLPAYQEFHRDLLFHQQKDGLWRPFFIGRAFEALLMQGSPWDESDRIVEGALKQLNDYVGYRPVATLDTGTLSDPYPHEFVRPIPIYVRDAGVASGHYEKIISLAMEILKNADEEILRRAWFDLDRLEEIAIDPRAYDFDHPANRRPNHHFGLWDPHQISNSGYYTRFVLQQITLDSLLSRCEREQETKGLNADECLYDAAAVLAGTILMASGTSGDGPGCHDSSVTLATLLPQIAAYRDDFYEQLVEQAKGDRGKRLQEEAHRYHQPFGAARQHLNAELARRRALQLQRVHLAHLFARLGYPEAAKQQADSVRVASARMLSEIYCRLTAGHDAIDQESLETVVKHLTTIEDLIHRAIECGALVDPWNVVGFAGNFSLFPALENTVHDWRVDELIDLVEQVLDLGARSWSEAAAVDNVELERQFSTILARLSRWWDQFATSTIEDLDRLVAKEIEVSANLVAGALNAWHKAGAAAGDIAFWRMFVDQFDSSKAFQLVIEALLDHGDTVAARALMMQWVSQKDRTPLEETDSSFRRLAFHWLTTVENDQESEDVGWDQVAKFFAYLEANAEEFWQVPSPMFDMPLGSMFDEVLDDIDGAVYFEEDEEEDEEDAEGELFEAAYEEMVYRDSTDDGQEGNIVDDGVELENSEWDYEVQRLEQRLDFLTTVASLWKHAAIAWGIADSECNSRSQILSQWLTQAMNNYRQLVELLESIHSYQFDQPSGSHDSLVEFDRLRTTQEALVQKVITTCVETCDAARLLAAMSGTSDTKDIGDPIDANSVAILQALLAGNADGVRKCWDSFVASLKPKALLYVPHSRGGEPRLIVATRGLQQLIYDLLGWMPQLGLIRETCQLLDLAQEMEREHSVGQGAVTEFDRLFENGYQAIVRSMVASAQQWDANQDQQQTQHVDHMLVDALQLLTEQQLVRWLSHSRTLRLSVVERLAEEKYWSPFVHFVQKYGADFFDQKFMSLGNLRGILHQGVDSWLDSLSEDPELVEEIRLLEDLEQGASRREPVELLSLAIEAVVENYRAYRDYNTTTTQSDHGELLYTLIDFLRLRAGYDRIAWNLKPVVWAHEILIRQNRALAAEMWCQAFAERTAEPADEHLRQLGLLCDKYGMRLATVADRVAERFVRPLLIDRVKALVEPALNVDDALRQDAFAALDREVASLASEPSGAGLDLPDWLAALEDEVTTARSRFNYQTTSERLERRIGRAQLSWQELLEQLEESE